MLPDITIVVTTWFSSTWAEKRRDITVKTIDSWRRHFKYEGKLNLHISDDGSDYNKFMPESVWYGKITKSRQERKGVGASLNVGFLESFKSSPLVIYAADDWSMTGELDLTPWAKLLVSDTTLGMIRFSPPHPNIKGSVMHLGNLGWALRLERYGFAFGHRPALYHKRFIDYYGWFEENKSALETERLYSERFNDNYGPDIALALPTVFKHIDGIELAYVNPEKGDDYGYLV